MRGGGIDRVANGTSLYTVWASLRLEARNDGGQQNHPGRHLTSATH